MRLDFTLVLYWTSLVISAGAVVLFLWLMRESRDTGHGTRDSDETRDKRLGTRDAEESSDSSR